MAMFRRIKRPSLALDMAPLIDVVFLLLIFFMLTSTFTEPSLPLTLPQAANTGPSTMRPVVVSLNVEGVVAINGKPVEMGGYEAALAAALDEAGMKSVNFRADEGVDYGVFLDVMDRSRNAGAAEFNLIHAPRP